MSLADVDLFGVYVAPMSVMMVAAWFVTLALRQAAVRLGLLHYRVWHPALFVFAVYIIVLSSWILVVVREFVMTAGEGQRMRRDPVDRVVSPPPPPESRAAAERRASALPFLITLGTVVLAGFLGSALWRVYLGSPWTRDATVRALVVTMAPEVAGRIVELPVVDNKYVHKGDLLMVIDPTNYTIGGWRGWKPRFSRRRRACRSRRR